MSEIKVISEEPITLAKLKDELAKVEKRDKELSTRASKVNEYLNTFTKMDNKKTEALIGKLKELNLLRLKDKHIVKIVDALPENVDSLKSLLAGESLTLKSEDLQKIIDVVNA